MAILDFLSRCFIWVTGCTRRHNIKFYSIIQQVWSLGMNIQAKDTNHCWRSEWCLPEMLDLDPLYANEGVSLAVVQSRKSRWNTHHSSLPMMFVVPAAIISHTTSEHPWGVPRWLCKVRSVVAGWSIFTGEQLPRICWASFGGFEFVSITVQLRISNYGFNYGFQLVYGLRISRI